MGTLRIEAGDRTEDLIQFVTRELDDETLDGIEIKREVRETSGVASEPVTTTVLLTLGTIAVRAVARLIERWLEMQHQVKLINIVADGFNRSPEVGSALAAIAGKYNQVSNSYELPREP